MHAELNVWGALGTQFLHLLVVTLKDEGACESDEYPLKNLSASERADVFLNAAQLFEAAPVSGEGRVRCDADARSFFAFLHRQSVPLADHPFSSFSDHELELLLERAWIPEGPSGDRLKARLSQLVHATCILRKSVAQTLGLEGLHVERYVWHPGAFATDEEINDALSAYGLPPRALSADDDTLVRSHSEAVTGPSEFPHAMLSSVLRSAGVPISAAELWECSLADC